MDGIIEVNNMSDTDLCNEELKPCPFCGGNNFYIIHESGTHVYCYICFALGPISRNGEEEAIALWNKRKNTNTKTND